MEALYFSPMLLGFMLLIAVGIATAALWAMTRPQPGPGYWMAGAWTLIVGVFLFAGFVLTRSPVLNVAGNALQLAGEALFLLGIFRFMGRQPPYWIVPAAVSIMVAFNVDYWVRDGNSDFLMGVYSTLAGLLPIQAIWLLLTSKSEPATRPARILVGLSLTTYACVTLLRGALGYREWWLDLPYEQPYESFSYLLPYNFALPALVMGVVGVALMTMQRILADSNTNARLARENANRFSRLLSVSTGGIALIENGRIVDANRQLEKLTRYGRDRLIGMDLQSVFVSEDQEQLAHLLRDDSVDLPAEMTVRRDDGSEFPAELTVTQLGDKRPGRSHLVELRSIAHRKAMEDELKQLARTDPLTGVMNRRAFSEYLDAELQRLERHSGQLALAMLDFDHFKRINDRYGHQVGDKVLRRFADLCREQARAIDVFARFGGEEFALLMPQTDAIGARVILERLLETVSSGPLYTDSEGDHLHAQLSAGLAIWRAGDTADSLLGRADQALYIAKKNGRNRVECLDPMPAAE